jgi:hypothetical protein
LCSPCCPAPLGTGFSRQEAAFQGLDSPAGRSHLMHAHARSLLPRAWCLLCVRSLGLQRLRVSRLDHSCTGGAGWLAPFSGAGLAASVGRSSGAGLFVPLSDAGLAAFVCRSSRAGWLVLFLGAGLAARLCRVTGVHLRCLGGLAGGPFHRRFRLPSQAARSIEGSGLVVWWFLGDCFFGMVPCFVHGMPGC